MAKDNEPKVTFSLSELNEYYHTRAQQEDEEERAKGRMQFNMVFLTAILGVLVFLFL